MLIPLSKGKFAKIDKEDYELVSQYRWHCNSEGYATTCIYLGKIDGKYKNKSIKMHRLLMDTPPNRQVDHKNGDTLDNRKSNLRNCTQVENQANQGLSKNNTSGFRGVRLFRNRWLARFHHNKKEYYLGYYDTAEEAALMVNNKLQEVAGDFARLNRVEV